MSELITPELVELDRDLGPDAEHVIRALAALVVSQGRATDADELAADALAREAKDATGIPGGIAIPHCRSASVTEPTLAMARLRPGVDFGAPDGPADLVFCIAAPEGADDAHLSMLSKLARSLIRPEFTQALRDAVTREDIVALVDEALGDGPAPTVAPTPAGTTTESAPSEIDGSRTPRIVAVTACATGIAHTFMAADALAAAAKKAGIDFHVEPQGATAVTPLDPAIIENADAVIFATDVDVRNRARFAGKPVIQVPVKRGIDQADELLARATAAATDPSAKRVGGASGSESAEQSGGDERVGKRIQRWLMTGVSYMIPFVAGGGLLIAIGFLLGGYSIDAVAKDIILDNSLWNLPEGGLGTYLGAVAFAIGGASMAFLVPVLAGYIAFAIADRPGIAPGFVAGAVAVLMNAGFLGGLVGGLLGGFAAWWLTTLKPPRWLAGLMPVVIIPLLASIFASGLMVLFLGGPIAVLMTSLTDWLSTLTGTGAIALGLLLGGMMCVDLGGPINKVAYSFAVAGLGLGSVNDQTPWMIMAAVMGAGMVPPIALALATLVAPRLFSPVERENGKAGWLLGAAFITEGAIPFAAADPLRIIPATIVGGAVTGAISMGAGVTSQAPHGGIFVFFAIGNLLWFIVAIIVGAIVSAGLVLLLKRFARRRPQADEAVAEGLVTAA